MDKDASDSSVLSETGEIGEVRPRDLFLHVGMLLQEHRVDVSVSDKERFHPLRVVWKTASTTHMSLSDMFSEEIAPEDVWKHGEKISSQSIRDVYVIQKKDELMGFGHGILDLFCSPNAISEETFEECGASF